MRECTLYRRGLQSELGATQSRNAITPPPPHPTVADASPVGVKESSGTVLCEPREYWLRPICQSTGSGLVFLALHRFSAHSPAEEQHFDNYFGELCFHGIIL